MDLLDGDFIECVRQYPILYQSRSKKHKSLVIRENCWNAIAEKLNLTPEVCKIKWRNIRDNYKKHQNRKKIGAACISKYDDERLHFIDEIQEERVTRPKSKTKRRKKRTSVEKQTSFVEVEEEHNIKVLPQMTHQIEINKNTPVHSFFNSMADIVCQFPPERIAQIRTQICNLVTEMELLVLATETEN